MTQLIGAPLWYVLWCDVGDDSEAEGHGIFNDLIHYWRALLGGDNIHRHRYQSYVRIRP